MVDPVGHDARERAVPAVEFGRFTENFDPVTGADGEDVVVAEAAERDVGIVDPALGNGEDDGPVVTRPLDVAGFPSALRPLLWISTR